ncbi:MAG: SdrD B-like domain-containing protein, partial [Tepidisphaeraceae bacterium]
NDVNGSGTYSGTDTLAATTTVQADGSYSFPNLLAGNYLVHEVVPAGFVRTAPVLTDYAPVTLANGNNVAGIDLDNAKTCCTSSVLSSVYYMDGTTRLTTLSGGTHQGDTVTVYFTVGSAAATLSLVSYTAPGSTFDATVASKQNIFDVATGSFAAGSSGSLTVTIPSCYYQIDFVCGAAIDHFGPAGSNIFYSAQSRLFSADNGGTVACCGNNSSLSGQVYYDANLDNVLDQGDSGISGVTVTLYNGTSKVATTTTNSNGFYSFMNLPAGTYTIVETQPSGYLDGADNVGTLGDTASGNDTFTVALPAATVGHDYNFGEIKPSTLSGYVYVDSNNDGIKQSTELGIFGVTIQLLNQTTGTTVATTTTAADGSYSFAGIVPGLYSVVEIQPAAYTDGKDTAGSLGGTAGNDIITSVNIGNNVAGTNYNFGEIKVCGSLLVGDTATIGFWANCNGQALITSLNGGLNATNLGNWLAKNFPNIYGNKNLNLAGKTNTQVAAQFVTFKNASGQKLDAQVMAVALAMYVTNSTLAGTVAAPYGFNVSTTGTAAKTINVGANGSAFGVSNNSNITVMNALLSVNNQAANGVLYNGNTSLQNMANVVFSNINQNGDRLG